MSEYTVTAIEQQKNNRKRYNLYLDGEFYSGLTEETIVFHRIKVGSTFSQKELQFIFNSMETQIAFDKCLNLLSRNMKTEKQIKDYLESKAYEENVIKNVITKLKQYKYLDDVAYVNAYLAQNKQTKGEYRIKQELLLKGISKQLVDELVVLEDEQEIFENVLAIAIKFIKGKSLDLKLLSKLNRHLLSRGFNFSVVNDVITYLKRESISLDDEDF